MELSKTFVICTMTVLVLCTAAELSSLKEDCYNQTHCTCSESNTEGNCYRFESGDFRAAQCSVEKCQGTRYACNCLGDYICRTSTCGSWKPIDEVTPAGVGGSVSCHRVEGGTCASKIDIPKPEKVEVLKMVQFGPNTADTTWNMTYSVDTDDYITNRWKNGGMGSISLHDSWPDNASLRKRHINFRLYTSADASNKFACMIVNRDGSVPDGVSNYRVKSEILAVDPRETISFVACDDWDDRRKSGECLPPLSGTALKSDIKGNVRHTDGWCVGPLLEGGSGIRIRVSDVFNLAAVNFDGSDGLKTVYEFGDESHGTTGEIDENGVVQGGALPEILINISGIKVLA